MAVLVDKRRMFCRGDSRIALAMVWTRSPRATRFIHDKGRFLNRARGMMTRARDASFGAQKKGDS